jgi:hypothetical protein
LWERYNRYVEQKEPLLTMAYFALTLLSRGDQRSAAAHFNIEYAIFRKLGELTSTRGDNLVARKAEGAKHPLSDPEKLWIETAVKTIIRHLAAGGGSQLTMAQLPPL